MYILSSLSCTALAILSAGLLATVSDITMTWTSPIYPKLDSNDPSINPLGRRITEDENSWIGSLINIGAILGPVPFGFIAERFGRKKALLCVAIPHFISFITFAFARHIYLFYFGRLFGGLAVGAGYSLLPMYVAEIAEDSKRGLYSVGLGVFWCFGDLLPFCIGPYTSIKLFNIILSCFPLMFFILFSMLGTETPFYLVGTNQLGKAEEVLRLLRSSSDQKGIEEELRHVKDVIKNEQHGHFSDILKNRGLRKAFIISEFLVIFQQMTGLNAIGFYLQTICEATGSKLPSDIAALIPSALSLPFSFILIFIVNRFGRKTLFIFSNIGMVLSLVAIGTFFHLKENTHISVDAITWLPIVNIIIYYFAFGMGSGVLPWTISSEIFPKNVKQISAASVSTTCWIFSFVVTKFFNSMISDIGTGGTFWFFAAWCLLAAVFTAFLYRKRKEKHF